jgi:hypothetical protein
MISCLHQQYRILRSCRRNQLGSSFDPYNHTGAGQQSIPLPQYGTARQKQTYLGTIIQPGTQPAFLTQFERQRQAGIGFTRLRQKLVDLDNF